MAMTCLVIHAENESRHAFSIAAKVAATALSKSGHIIGLCHTCLSHLCMRWRYTGSSARC